jgi:hypothetical protein
MRTVATEFAFIQERSSANHTGMTGFVAVVGESGKRTWPF